MPVRLQPFRWLDSIGLWPGSGPPLVFLVDWGTSGKVRSERGNKAGFLGRVVTVLTSTGLLGIHMGSFLGQRNYSATYIGGL